MSDAVPDNSGEREPGQTETDPSATAETLSNAPHPALPGSNPRIGGAELTKEPFGVEASASRRMEPEAAQTAADQLAFDGDQSLSRELVSRQSHNQPKEKFVGSEPESTADFFTAADIARALGTYKKKVLRAARREKWPMREVANRLELQPPKDIAAIVLATPEFKPAVEPLPNGKVRRFADVARRSDRSQVEKVNLRLKAVELVNANLALGKETALLLVVQKLRVEHPAFDVSVTSLRRWCKRHATHGLDGLVEQRTGSKPFVNDLDSTQLLATTAAAVEYGLGRPAGNKDRGRLNVARAYRDLVDSPTLTGDAREWCHGAHASKSYVPPSVRKAIKRLAPPLTAKLIQVGPKAAKLDGPYTECSYENVKPGQAFTADDMTANVYVWVEWPNAQGWLLLRPQILASLDVGSLMWLNVRAVVRPRGQYTKDDVWGMIGDTLDNYGLFDVAILEGGIWQSNVIRGYKTGLDDERRFGGLKALGVKLIHTRTPRGKIIEGMFHQLQHAADNCPGFCGRNEQKDCPEHVRKEIALCEAGKAHPRQFFMHFDQYVSHLTNVMAALNHERGDGKVLRGQTPLDKWTEQFPVNEDFAALRRFMPESDRWMYRSCYSKVRITRNGVRVTQGSGANQMCYTYGDAGGSRPEVTKALEEHRGQTALVYWNDYDPDTDAVIYTIADGRPDQFLCVAPRVPELDRLGATETQLRAEAARKKAIASLAVSKSKNLTPYLKRKMGLVVHDGQRAEAADPAGADIASRIKAARAEAEAKRAEEQRNARAVDRAVVEAEDLQAATEREIAPESAEADRGGAIDPDLANLFSTDQP